MCYTIAASLKTQDNFAQQTPQVAAHAALLGNGPAIDLSFGLLANAPQPFTLSPICSGSDIPVTNSP